MKNSTIKQGILIIIFLFTSTVFSSTLYAKNKSHKGNIEFKFNKKEQIGNSFVIDVLFNLNEFKVKSNKSINYAVVISDHSNMIKIPILSFKGRNNFKAYEKKRAMSEIENDHTDVLRSSYIVTNQSKETSISFSRSLIIPYENWFRNATIFIEKNVGNCGNEYFVASEKIASISLKTTFLPHLAYIEPEIESIKRRNTSIECLIDFAHGSHILEETYKDNETKLKLINLAIDSIILDKYSTINKITIVGYASPEGDIEANEALSKSRALSIRNYINKNHYISDSLYDIQFGGEDWDALRTAIKHSDMPRKSELMLMLDFEKDADNRTEILKNIDNGTVYSFLLDSIYPKLRKVIVNIDYKILPFNLEKAKIVIVYRPQNLSLNEMYNVANSYEKGSSEFNNVFDIAVELFPKAPIANLNAAITAINKGDIDKADNYLKAINPNDYTKEYYNTKGVLEVMKGNTDLARSYFENSYGTGLKMALKNLKQIKGKKRLRNN